MITHKTCYACKTELDINLFYKKCDTKDGFTSRCRSCIIKSKPNYSLVGPELREDGLKSCARCKLEMPITEFTKSKIYRDGHNGRCKKCDRYYEEINLQKRAESKKEYRRTLDPEVKRAYQRKWKEKNKDKLYNPERYKIYREKKKSENPEAFLLARREQHLKGKFGINKSQFDKMLEDQNSVCAICGNISKNYRKNLAVDHCHKTNKVRALLCSGCNLTLGHIDDNIDTLVRMIDYLKKHSATG